MTDDSGPSAATLNREMSHQDTIPKTFAVELAPVTYAAVFMGLYCIHAVCAVYCFTTAMLFQALPGTEIMLTLDFYAATLPSKYFGTIASAHYVVGGVHCVFIAIPLIQILCRPLQAFEAVRALESRTASVFRTRILFSPPNLQHRLLQKARRAVRGIYNAVFARTGFFGVESRYFDSLFLLREVYDVLMQTYQAYQMCLLLPRPMLNRFYVATLVVNCWSSPLIHHFVKSVPLQRVLCHVCDMVLDLISAVGVPLFLMAGYMHTRIEKLEALWWDLNWFINAMNDSPLILFGSWLDALARLGFSIALLLSLDDVKLLLKYRKAAKGRSPTAIVPESEATVKAPSKDTISTTAVRTTTRRATVFTMTHRLLVIYGFAVLGIQLHAELRPDPSSSCILRVRPWLITQPACALLELNCLTHKQHTGNATDFDAVFGNLNPLTLEQIEIRHCSNVEIQPTIQKFKNLIGIKLYNSSIIRWEENAALTESYHKRLRSVLFIRTQFANSTLPAGLLSSEFPILLRFIQFSVTNLKWIPSDLHERWPPGTFLRLELSELTEFPLTFTKADFTFLALYYNQITSVPAEAFATMNWELTGNPITYLPEGVDVASVEGFAIMMESTNLTALPSWLEDEKLYTTYSLRAGRTPLCENVVLQANASELEDKPWLHAVECWYLEGMPSGMYPLDLEVRDDEVW